MLAINEQASLQPTLNKWAGSASLTIFVTLIVPKTKKKFEKAFLKTQKVFFEKSGLSLVGDYIAMFNS